MHSAVIDWLTHHKLLNWLLVSFSNTKPSLFYFQCKEKLWLPGSIIANLWFTELPSPSQPDFAFPNEKTKTSRPKQPDFTFPMHRHIHWTFCEPLWVLLSCFSFFTEGFCQICDQMERQSCPQPPFFEDFLSFHFIVDLWFLNSNGMTKPFSRRGHIFNAKTKTSSRPLHWRLMIGLIFWFPFFIFHTKAKPSNCLRNFSQSITSWRTVWPVVWLDSLYFGFTNSLTCSAK